MHLFRVVLIALTFGLGSLFASDAQAADEASITIYNPDHLVIDWPGFGSAAESAQMCVHSSTRRAELRVLMVPASWFNDTLELELVVTDSTGREYTQAMQAYEWTTMNIRADRSECRNQPNGQITARVQADAARDETAGSFQHRLYFSIVPS